MNSNKMFGTVRYGLVPEFYKSFGKEISTDLLLNLRPYLLFGVRRPIHASKIRNQQSDHA